MNRNTNGNRYGRKIIKIIIRHGNINRDKNRSINLNVFKKQK